MTALGFILLALVIIHVGCALRAKYTDGLALCVFYLVWLPHGMRIETVGAIPELTIHRLLILMALGAGLAQHRPPIFSARIPLSSLIRFLLVAYAVSMLFSEFRGDSFKGLLGVIFENFLIFFLVIANITSREDTKKLLNGVCGGVMVSALIAIVEYYKSVNVISWLVLDHTLGGGGASVAGYQHEIHLGYVMAMALPLLIVQVCLATTATRRWFWRFCLMLAIAACYCSQKRGPWMGSLLGMAILLALSTGRIRKEFYWVGLLVAILMMVKPGVRETVFQKLDSVFIHDGEQEASAEYRRILWVVAWDKITQSPIRFLFGLGGMATEHMDISDYFGKERGGIPINQQGFSSWDSQWAANLVQYGIVGFVGELALRLAIFIGLFKQWKQSIDLADKTRAAAIIAAIAVYGWAMFTVTMFSPQLKYMLWTLVAMGIASLSYYDAPKALGAEEDGGVTSADGYPAV